MEGQALQFLEALFKNKRPDTAIQLWNKSNKKTYTFSSAERAAASAAATLRDDVYVAAGLGPKVFPRPQSTRGQADSVVGIPGVWADIDVNGGPEAKTGAAPTMEDALKLASSIVKPTIIVNSGYGIQPWWLFDEGVWTFLGKDGVEQQQHAARLVRSFQSALRKNAQDMGFTIDSTHDLSRLMRVPETFNCKGVDAGGAAAPVMLVLKDGPTYTLATIEAATDGYRDERVAATQRATGADINIVLRGSSVSPPMYKIEELININSDFGNVWNHKFSTRSRMADWSMNEFEMSIANHIAIAGFSTQEMADTLVYHRLKYGDPKGKADRIDYITATIAKALAAVDRASRDDDERQERTDAINALSDVDGEPEVEPSRVAAQFSKVVGGPTIKELIQNGNDPDTCRYRLGLADGREVPIGTARNLLDFNTFREKFMVVTTHVARDVKRDQWLKIVGVLLKAAQITNDDPRSSRIRAIVDQYIDRGLSTDRAGACAAMDPWEDEFRVYVHAGQLTQWIRRVLGERMSEADVRQYLIAGGFERKTMGYVEDDGRKNTRSYWFIDKQDFYASEPLDDPPQAP